MEQIVYKNVEVPVPIEANKFYLDNYIEYIVNSQTTMQFIYTLKDIKHRYFRFDNYNPEIKVYAVQLKIHIVQLY